MKKITFCQTIILSVILIFGFSVNTFSQKATIELTFTAVNNTGYILLDSIYIENLTQGGDTTLFAPQIQFVLDYVTGINDGSTVNSGLLLSQNYPNPIQQQTNINLVLPEKDDVTFRIQNLMGQEVTFFKGKLSSGNHTFTFYPGNADTYFLTAYTSSGTQSIKMLNTNKNRTTQCKIVYSGPGHNQAVYKSAQNTSGFVFSLGDELRCIGYAKTTEQYPGSDIIENAPTTDMTYLFEIGEGIPCQEQPYFMYEGQQYNTVQIDTQCWMAENLNVGTMINGDSSPTNNDTIEKYCYNDDVDNCDTYGGLYEWNEMMDYSSFELSQGICPDGWHLPTDYEWKILEGTVDSQFPVNDIIWDEVGFRGFDAGGNLKETDTIHWFAPNEGATNLNGFTGIAGGYRLTNGTFDNLMDEAIFWTSSKSGSEGWRRFFDYNSSQVHRSHLYQNYGFSVRCLKNPTNNQPPSQPSNPIPEDQTIDISIATLLSWTCTDPDGDDLDYNLYFGTDSNPSLIVENLTGTIYNPILVYETTYYWKVVAFDIWGDSTTSNTWSFTTGIYSDPCIGDTSLIYEGQTYGIVGIGAQCWMAENLKTTTYNNGTSIPNVTDANEWSNLTSGAYVWFDNDISWDDSYGALYNWYTTVDTNGLCPAGWHVPTDDEWTVLTDYIGGTSYPHGNELKSCRQVNSPLGGGCNTNEHPRWNLYEMCYGTDDYDFSGLPGGFRSFNGAFLSVGGSGIWWSSSEYSSNDAWYHGLSLTSGSLFEAPNGKQFGLSVRCLRDN